MDVVIIVNLILSVICLILLAVIILKKPPEGKADTTNADQSEVLKRLDKLGGVIDYTNDRIKDLNNRTEYRLNNIQQQLTEDIKFITQANAQNLESIRATVDKKLDTALEGTLGKSYSIITKQLEAVYSGLGEVKGIAESVGDIKKVFTNVKLRGTWGETQLDALLCQMLSPEQYQASVRLNPLSREMVDFAVKMPSKDDEIIWLPIDSKFPIEEYQRLLNAYDAYDKKAETEALKNLERAVKKQAESIAEKYILPPTTTDFAIMYLPLEGLYAELLKMPALSEILYQKRIMACGPANLGALLSTIQTGFKTAAIEKRSSELWSLLTTFRGEFERFAQALEKTQKKLHEAQESIDSATKRTRAMTKRLDKVDLPSMPAIPDLAELPADERPVDEPPFLDEE